jgi:Flp pilus assembly protein TadD
VQDAYAWALHAAGRSAEALPIARAAARLGLRSPSFAYHLGVVEASAGDAAAARQALQRALDLNPTFSRLHAPRAAALLERLGG